MILSGQSIRERNFIQPFELQYKIFGVTGGLGPAGYDIRLREDVLIEPGGFMLGSSIEHLQMPHDLVGMIKDKSTWIRRGLTVGNTVIEPGWRGFLTLELFNNSKDFVGVNAGCPIAQVVFQLLDQATESPYNGKYQDQPNYPIEAQFLP